MIPLMKSAFHNEVQTRRMLADFILETDRLSMGSACKKFEGEFGYTQGRKYSLLVNSGASANLGLLQALINLGRLDKGDAVAFSSVTWGTNVMPIIQLGLVPVPVDCNPRTLNSGKKELEAVIQRQKPRAFFLTNALGLTDDIDEVRKLCSEQGIILIEDSCEAIGSEVNGTKTGNFGLAATFSFFVAHHMSTIEGGMICTDDEELYDMLVQVRANGWDRNLSVTVQKKLRAQHKVESEFYSKYTFYNLAFNIRPTEITGFLGSCQLEYLEESVSKREEYFLRIQEVVRTNPDFMTLEYAHMNRVSAFAMPFVLKTSELQKEYVNRFSSYGIEIRPMIAGNIERQPFYKDYVVEKSLMPGADHIHNCGFYCGNYPELSEEDLQSFESCIIR